MIPRLWSPGANTASETIPSFALAKVTGVTGGVFQLAKPTADHDPYVVVVGPVSIPQSRSGEVTHDAQITAAYEQDDGTPAVGETWGVKAGSWLLRKDYRGFRILGGAGGGLVNVLRIPEQTGGRFFARLTSSSASRWKWVALTLNSSGAYVDDGSESADYTAIPLTIDGSTTPRPYAGMRVLMLPSEYPGFYEFIPWAASPLTTKGDLWVFSTLDTRLPVGTNTYVLTADSAEALGVKWSAVGGSGIVDGDYGDITVSGAATTWTIDNGVVTDAKFRDSAALSVVGRSANSSGSVADIAAGTDAYVLRRSGTSLGFGQVATGGIADAAVTDAKLRDSAALSVIGRSANSTGVPADIAAASDDYVLRRSGTTLAFGRVATGGITDSAVTYAKIQNVSATNRILGRITSGAGVVEELTATNVLVILGYPSGTGGAGARWIGPIVVTYADVAVAATNNDIEIYSLPAGAMIHHAVGRCTTDWDGGAWASVTLTGVGTVSAQNRYLQTVALDPGGDAAAADQWLLPESWSGSTSIRAYFQMVGENLDTATAGSVSIWLLVSQLP